MIQSQTEFMGDTGQAVINATLFAIDEINRSGGVLGRQIRPIVGDGQSDETGLRARSQAVARRRSRPACCSPASPQLTAARSSRWCASTTACSSTPVSRKGSSRSPTRICLGPLPNQHILPGVDWFRKTLGKRRFYFVGSDTVYVRAVRAILGDFAPSISVEIVGESYVNPADVVGWAVQTVQQIELIEPDAIVTLLQGKANLPFIHRLRARRITPARIPTLSCTFTEHDLRNILGQMAGDYLCGHYYQSLDTRENARFLARLADDPRLGDTPVVSDAMVAAYMGVHVWRAAVARAGTFEDQAAIRRAMVASSLPGPGGPVRIDPVSPLRREVLACRPGGRGPADLHPLVVPRPLQPDHLPGHADPRPVGRADPGAPCALGWLLVEPRFPAGNAGGGPRAAVKGGRGRLIHTPTANPCRVGVPGSRLPAHRGVAKDLTVTREETVLLHFLLERCPVDHEGIGGLLTVPAARLKGAKDQPFLGLRQRLAEWLDAHLGPGRKRSSSGFAAWRRRGPRRPSSPGGPARSAGRGNGRRLS